MPKLLYFISEDWFFCSHFLDRARAAQKLGYEVVVLTRVGRHGDALRAAGFRLVPLHMERSSINPLRELGVLRQVWRVYRTERPDLLHHVALKPILYGSLLARCLGLRAVVNAPVGMGYVFTSQGTTGRLLRGAVQLALRFLLNPPGSKVVFENVEDLRNSIARGSVRACDGVLIQGAGVDTEVFHPGTPSAGAPIAVLGARMLRDKGVFEFVEAARILKTRGVSLRCVLVGAPDVGNPSSIAARQLADWQAQGAVEWWGHCEDMATVLRRCQIACLPSYREGLPKFLLEAMACGLPVVSTDVTGCRDAVVNGRTGWLVPPRDAVALAAALERLATDRDARQRMGGEGLALARQRFDLQRIATMTSELYQTLAAAR